MDVGRVIFLTIGLLVASVLASGQQGVQQQDSAAASAASSQWNLLPYPPKSLELITEYIEYSINVSLIYNGTDPLADEDVTVTVTMSNPLTLLLSNSTLRFSRDNILNGENQTLLVTGQVIGYVHLNFHLENDAFKDKVNVCIVS